MNDIQAILFTIAQSLPGFLLAVVAHEWSHGAMALYFGDNTALKAKRLTFNPMAHIDTFGTIIFPLISALAGWAVFGWAKPVPINPRNFKGNVRKAIFWVSFAGPLANIILGTISALLFAIVATQIDQTFSLYSIFLGMLQYSILINFLLASFNLLPLPPLDGSRMVASFLKGEALRRYESVARFTPMIFLGIIVLSMMGVPTIGRILTPAVMIGQKITLIFVQILS